MNIAVIGSRTFQDQTLLNQVLSKAFSKDDTLISGGAKGADQLAETWARRKGITCRIFKPDWQRHSRSAGFKRNHTIIAHADKVIAFWDGQSKGTAHSIEMAKKKGLAVEIADF